MPTLSTSRLTISDLSLNDAPFILALVNTPGWLRFIGDRGVYDLTSAENYLSNGPINSYKENGFGLYKVSLHNSIPIGMCGFLKRSNLAFIDIGFAILPEYEGKGYMSEAVEAVLAYGRNTLGLKQIGAITTQDNETSIKLLSRFDFRFDKLIQLSPGEQELKLFLKLLK